MKASTMISHPSNVANQKKIKRMLLKYGLMGYGLFWVTIEVMAECKDMKLKISSRDMDKVVELSRLPYRDVIKMLGEFANEFHILNSDNEYLTSGILTNIPENLKAKERKEEAEKLFKELWKTYPVKRGLGQVSDSKKLELLGHGKEVIAKCIERYKEFMSDKDYDFKNGSTFFNSGYIDYLDENFLIDASDDGMKSDVKSKILEKAGHFGNRKIER